MSSPIDLTDPANAVLAGYRYRELEFDKGGNLVHPNQVSAVGQLAGEVSDLLVIAHGWNNDIEEARSLYRGLATSFESVRGSNPMDLAGRTIGIVGVLWPSKRFDEADLIPGGAAGLASDPTLPDDLRALADVYGAEQAATLEQAALLAPDLDDSAEARQQYADLLRSLIDPAEAEEADAVEQLMALPADQLFDLLQSAMMTVLFGASMPGPVAPGQSGDGIGGAAGPGPGGIGLGGIGRVVGPDDSGAGAGLGNAVRGLWSKGRALLNFTTYYTMKARAGRIGQQALAPVLRDQVAGKTRLHLIGHSFGALLVTAAATALPGSGGVNSISLLQGAFSHNALSADFDGAGSAGGYRHLIDAAGVRGPIIVTHTRNDRAVGIAYAIASSIAHQNNSAIGDAHSPYGGMGSNGAQHTTEARNDQALQDASATYSFRDRFVHNLLADKYIAGHGDVRNVQVANAVLQAVIATPASPPEG